MTTVEQIFINIFIIFWIIFLSTFFQKHYYKILWFISWKSPKIIRLKIKFITRFWIILHEFSHAFFSFLSWHKIQEINLFSKNWWNVKYLYKNYIQGFWKWIFSFNYWIKLIFNQIWIFLTSFWPLIFWIILNYFFWNIIFWIDIKNLDANFLEIFKNLDFLKIIYLIIYFLLIPTFILSWKDISHFFIS